jgi:hypothetical protein
MTYKIKKRFSRKLTIGGAAFNGKPPSRRKGKKSASNKASKSAAREGNQESDNEKEYNSEEFMGSENIGVSVERTTLTNAALSPFGAVQNPMRPIFGEAFGPGLMSNSDSRFTPHLPRMIQIGRGINTQPLSLSYALLDKLKKDSSMLVSVIAGVGRGAGEVFHPSLRQSRFGGKIFSTYAGIEKHIAKSKKMEQNFEFKGGMLNIKHAFSRIRQPLSDSGIDYDLFEYAADDLLQFLVANESSMPAHGGDIQLAELKVEIAGIDAIHASGLELKSVSKEQYMRGKNFEGRGGETSFRKNKIAADVQNASDRNLYMNDFSVTPIQDNLSMFASLPNGLFALGNPENAVCCHTLPSSPDLNLAASCSSLWIDLCVTSENYIIRCFGLLMKRVPLHFFGSALRNSQTDRAFTDKMFGGIATFEYFFLFERFGEVLRAEILIGQKSPDYINDCLRRFKMDMFHVFRTLKLCTCFLTTSLEVTYTKKEKKKTFLHRAPTNVRTATTLLGNALFSESLSREQFIGRIVDTIGNIGSEVETESMITRVPILVTLSGAAMFKLKEYGSSKDELRTAWLACKFDSKPEEFASSLLDLGYVFHEQLSKMLNTSLDIPTLNGNSVFTEMVGKNNGAVEFDKLKSEEDTALTRDASLAGLNLTRLSSENLDTLAMKIKAERAGRGQTRKERGLLVPVLNTNRPRCVGPTCGNLPEPLPVPMSRRAVPDKMPVNPFDNDDYLLVKEIEIRNGSKSYIYLSQKDGTSVCFNTVRGVVNV